MYSSLEICTKRRYKNFRTKSWICIRVFLMSGHVFTVCIWILNHHLKFDFYWFYSREDPPSRKRVKVISSSSFFLVGNNDVEKISIENLSLKKIKERESTVVGRCVLAIVLWFVIILFNSSYVKRPLVAPSLY